MMFKYILSANDLFNLKVNPDTASGDIHYIDTTKFKHALYSTGNLISKSFAELSASYNFLSKARFKEEYLKEYNSKWQDSGLPNKRREEVDTLFTKLLSKLVDEDVKNISFDFTTRKSLYLSCGVLDDYSIRLELFFEDSPGEEQIVYDVYHQGESISSDFGQLDDTLFSLHSELTQLSKELDLSPSDTTLRNTAYYGKIVWQTGDNFRKLSAPPFVDLNPAAATYVQLGQANQSVNVNVAQLVAATSD